MSTPTPTTGKTPSKVTPMTPQISQEDVDKAAKALGAGTSSGFGSGNAIDGRPQKTQTEIKDEQEQEEEQTASSVPDLNKEVAEYIDSYTEQMISLEADRAEINAKMDALRKEAKAKGFDTDGLKAAMRIKQKADESSRFNYDKTYIMARQVIEAAIDPTIFDMFLHQPQVDKSKH